MWESQVRILSRVPELSLKRWKEMPKALDLKGQRFGKLIAIKKAKSKNGKLIGYVDAIVVSIKKFKLAI